MTVRKKSQSKTRMQGKTSYRARYVELAHQGFPFRAASLIEKWPRDRSRDGADCGLVIVPRTGTPGSF